MLKSELIARAVYARIKQPEAKARDVPYFRLLRPKVKQMCYNYLAYAQYHKITDLNAINEYVMSGLRKDSPIDWDQDVIVERLMQDPMEAEKLLHEEWTGGLFSVFRN